MTLPHRLAAVVTLALAHSIASAQTTVQERFDRALPRVSKWVAGMLERTEPLDATVEVLDTDAFRERAVGHLKIPGEPLPGAMIAVTKPDASILVSRPMFETLVERAAEHDLFADDMVTLVLAHELTHAAHLDTLADIQPGPNADAGMLERVLITSVVREAHAVFVQHQVAESIGGEAFARFSRDLIASTPLASPHAKLVAAAEMMLRLEHQRAGPEAVMNVLRDPPATAAEIIERSSPRSMRADSIFEAVESRLAGDNWTRMTREGLGPTLGQAWRWLTPEQRAEIDSSVRGSTLVTLMDAHAEPPKMVSVSIIEFNDVQGASDAPEQLGDVISLMVSRFGYTQEGGRREVTLEPPSPGSLWRAIAGDHPMPGGRWGFGAVAVTQKDNLFVVVNAVSAPANTKELDRLLEAIRSAL